MAPQGNMSHAEIWDDSALVDSWNDALEEYKARGENVEDVLKTADDQNNGSGEQMDYEGVDDRAVEAHPEQTLPEETVDHVSDRCGNDPRGPDWTSEPDQTSDRKQPALPQHLIGQVHDDGLKNLLMSWYYAGYYTGLYEGQRQGPTTKHAKHET